MNINAYSPRTGNMIRTDNTIINEADLMTGAGLAVAYTQPQVDAFGRVRVSNPTTLFDSSQEYTYHPLLFEHVLAGTGAATYTQARNSTILKTGGVADAARAMRQSKVYWRYQPGKSQLVKITGVLGYAGTHAGASYVQMGYGDDRNGFFARLTAAGMAIVKRTDTSGAVVETVITSANWNLDPMDGSGGSGLTLDPGKSQIFVVDLQWLAVGRVRLGWQIGGSLTYCHEFTWANEGVGAYMRTANLPVRWEAYNAGAAGADVSLEAICVAIESEGGVHDSVGLTFSAGTKGVQVACPAAATLTPLVSLRLKDTFGGITYRGHVKPYSLEGLASSNAAYWELIWNATLIGPTWAGNPSADYSGAEFDIAATAVTGGITIESGYLGAGGGASRVSVSAGITTKLLLARTYAGVRDTVTLAARGMGGASNVAATIDYIELY